MSRSLALAFVFAGPLAAARAQVVVPAEPGVVYYYPAPAEPAPVGPAADSPLRRGLQLLADPTRLLPGDAGRPGSQYPALDAAPGAVRLVSFGLFVTSASAAGALAGIPPALRLGRVLLVGPPPVAANRRDTLLWIASPVALYARNRVRDRTAAEAQQTVMTPGAAYAAPCEPPHRRRLFGRWR